MKLNLRNKLLAAFAAVLVLTAIVGWVGISQAGVLNERTQDVANDTLASAVAMSEITQDTMLVRAKVLAHILSSDPAKKATLDKEIADLDADIDKYVQAWRKADRDGRDAPTIDALVKAWAYFKEGRDGLTLAASRVGKTEEAANHATGEVGKRFQGVTDALIAARKGQRQTADAVIRENAATYDGARWLIVGVTLAAVLVGIGLGFFLARSITSAAKQMVQAAEQIAQTDLASLANATTAMAGGDLTQTVAIQTQALTFQSSDEMGDLARAFNQMIGRLQETGRAFREMTNYLVAMAGAAGQIAQGNLGVQVKPVSEKDALGNAFAQMVSNLKQVVGDIVTVSEKLAAGDLTAAPAGEYGGEFVKIKNALTAALDGLNNTIRQTNLIVAQVAQSVDQVRSVSQDLASSAQEQSSAVEEVASSVERTDTQTKNSADNASAANQLVGQTASLADVGQHRMKALTDAMGAINASSQEIAKIIKVIDEIAFQTNLLALNAAVEAARAGQHGRGFAVVAQEVRNLAERSAKAAKSTAELIEDAGRRVQEGVKITNETGGALGEIVQNVVKVKDLVAEIAAASEEQTKALAQISAAMVQVNQGAQSSSAQSEELASTADELGGLAERLRQEAARFQLRSGRGFEGVEGGVLPAELAAGLTPELLQALSQAMQQQSKSAKLPTRSVPSGDGPGVAVLDRDARGYEQF